MPNPNEALKNYTPEEVDEMRGDARVATATGKDLEIRHGTTSASKPTVPSERVDAEGDAGLVTAYLTQKYQTPAEREVRRAQAAVRLAGKDLDETASGYFANAIRTSLTAAKNARVKAALKSARAEVRAAKAARKKAVADANEARKKAIADGKEPGALNVDPELPVVPPLPTEAELANSISIDELFNSLPALERIAANAAVTFATDKWRLERNDTMPAPVASRLGGAANKAIVDGADPRWVIRCASAMYLFANLYEQGYAQSGRFGTASTANRSAAMFQAFELSLRDQPWQLVRDAIMQAGAEHSKLVEANYDRLAARAGAAPLAPTRRARYSLAESMDAAMAMLLAEGEAA